MKTLLSLIALATIISCQNAEERAAEQKKNKVSALDINFYDLHNACDYMFAAEKAADEILEIAGDKEKDELSLDEKKQIEKLGKMLSKLNEIGKEKVSKLEAKECAGFARTLEKLDKIKEHNLF